MARIDKTTSDFITGLRASDIEWLEDAEGRFRIRILGRGENGFYEDDQGRALLFELIAGDGCIFSRSIRQWDNGRRVSDDERMRILRRLEKYLGRDGAPVIVR